MSRFSEKSLMLVVMLALIGLIMLGGFVLSIFVQPDINPECREYIGLSVTIDEDEYCIVPIKE